MSAQLQVRVNGGAPSSGAITASLEDAIQLTAADKTGWGSPAAQWEIYSYPDGFSEPSGWSTSGDSYVFVGNDDPPEFDLPTEPGLWGKFLFRLTVDDEIDEDTAVQILGPIGIEDVAGKEEAQFGGMLRGWAGPLSSSIRTIASASDDAVDFATAAVLAAFTRTGNVIEADANGALSVDGFAPALGQTVLVQDDAEHNGPHIVLDPGSAGTPWRMVRTSRLDTSAKIVAGMSFYVRQGTANEKKTFTLTTLSGTLNTTSLTLAASDHGALTGLTDDDHTQYLLASGTRAMAGDLNLNSNDINNVLTVNSPSGQPIEIHGAVGLTLENDSASEDMSVASGRHIDVTTGSGTGIFRLNTTFIRRGVNVRVWDGEATADTTDATPENVTLFSTSLIPAGLIRIAAIVFARATEGDFGLATFALNATIEHDASPAIVESSDPVMHSNANGAGWTAVLAVSGGNVVVTITGDADDDVDWGVTWEAGNFPA